MRRARAIAVAIHDVEPATYEHCALIRDWLDDHGIERVTLLVIPAPDLHSFAERSPELAAWLLECRDRGDAIAQHGLCHRRRRAPGGLRRPVTAWQGGAAAEFPGLDPTEARAAVDAGRHTLARAGLSPRGFVAPAYAYTPALRAALAGSFDWWASMLWIWRDGARPSRALAPALGLGTSSPAKRALSPPLVRAAAAGSPRLLRLDVHPADFQHTRHVRALEAVLRRSHRRRAVTYDDLV